MSSSSNPNRIGLYLIDGERTVPRSLRGAVVALDQRFIEEDGRSLLPAFSRPSDWAEGDEVWLWLDDETGREVGFASLRLDRGERCLERVWLASEYRHLGVFEEAWGEWCDRYGTVVIDHPNAFLRIFAERRGVAIR